MLFPNEVTCTGTRVVLGLEQIFGGHDLNPLQMVSSKLKQNLVIWGIRLWCLVLPPPPPLHRLSQRGCSICTL